MEISGKILTFKVEVQFLIELKGSIVVLPILAEELEEPFLCEFAATVVLLLIIAGVGALGEGDTGCGLGVVHALTGRASLC